MLHVIPNHNPQSLPQSSASVARVYALVNTGGTVGAPTFTRCEIDIKRGVDRFGWWVAKPCGGTRHSWFLCRREDMRVIVPILAV